MGDTTTNLALYKPSEGEVGWAALVDGNFDTIDAARMGTPVTVFGATGDGVTDDTAAIQDAIDTIGDYKAILFPKGNYYVTDQGAGFCLDISSSSGVYLLGTGGSVMSNPSGTGGAARIFTDDASTTIIKAESASLNHRGPRVENIRIEDGASSGGCICFSLKDYNNYVFRNVVFHGRGGTTTGTGLKIDAVEDASYGRIDNCSFHRNLTGLSTHGSAGVAVSGCYFNTLTTNGVLCDLQGGSSGVSVTTSKFETNTPTPTVGVVGVQVATAVNDVSIISNFFEGVAIGILTVAAVSLAYRGTVIALNHFTGSNSTETGVSIGANRKRDMLISNHFANLGTNFTDAGTDTVVFPTRNDGARTGEWMRINGVTYAIGAGSPQSVVTAPVGSIYQRTDGSTNTILYVKESGTGNTGWAALGAAGSGGAVWASGAATYSTSITPNVTGLSRLGITVTDTTAFTINAPTGGVVGQIVMFVITNTSGGTIGDVTWNAAFFTSWTNAASKPTNGKRTALLFCFDGTNWMQAGLGASI